jgi:hypothetical protein
MLSKKDFLEEELTLLEPKLNSMWKDQSKKQGWNPSVSKAVTISTKPNAFGFNYPVNMQSKVQDEEYGLAGNKPKPAIRSFTYDASKEVKGAVYKALSADLLDEGLI